MARGGSKCSTASSRPFLQSALISQRMASVIVSVRELELIHTPGHALHHYAVIDAAHASIFPGDTFGISYREMDSPRGAFIAPATTPTQFDPDQFIASIDRM